MDKEYPMEPGLYLMDCMEGMKRFPDGFFDIAICDPPYGDGNIGGGVQPDSTNARRWNRFGGWFDRYKTVEPIRAEVRQIQGEPCGSMQGTDGTSISKIRGGTEARAVERTG